MNLAYLDGFRQTSLADIAKEARVPLGNVYYLLQDQGGDRRRLCSFVQMTADNWEMLARGGCPIGTHCTELQGTGISSRSIWNLLCGALASTEGCGPGRPLRGPDRWLPMPQRRTVQLVQTWHSRRSEPRRCSPPPVTAPEQARRRPALRGSRRRLQRATSNAPRRPAE
jgi:hypothetical protein